MTTNSGGRFQWTRWSLARQLPLVTAMIIAIVVAFSLTLTYRALLQARSETLHTRMEGVMRALTQSAAQGTRTRVTLLRSIAADSVVTRALAMKPGVEVPPDSALQRALGRLTIPTDSGLPVELWTTDARRVAHIGTDIRGDSVAQLPPEMRSQQGTRISEVPVGVTGGDSVQFGSLYSSGGRVLFWAVVPVLRDGKRIGYITQQRRVIASPLVRQLLRDLAGEDLSFYYRNLTDDFTSSIDGTALPPPLRRDTTSSGYTIRRAEGPQQIGFEAHLSGVPYLLALETPRSSLIEGPRSTLRDIALLSLMVLIAGVLAAWALSRQVVRPLGVLATATEAIAHGDYGRRIDTSEATSDEILRLGSSFNQMASEVEASQSLLETQVEEALAVSEQLEQANTQLQETSTEAELARDAAVEANRAKSDFLAVMSHELRTPLNAIGGYTEILQLGIYGPVNTAQTDALVRIARSQQTLLALINDVLNFAKLEAGKVRYTISDVRVAPAIGSLEELIAPQLSTREISYTVQPCDSSITVRADPDKLQQILINLLSNAIKYSLAGSRIDVWCEERPDEVLIHVRDTGIGIAADRIEKIFDPFIQVGRALNRPHEGVGLGLSISRDLALGMGGALAVESELGVGSTFTLTLARSGGDSTPT